MAGLLAGRGEPVFDAIDVARTAPTAGKETLSAAIPAAATPAGVKLAARAAPLSEDPGPRSSLGLGTARARLTLGQEALPGHPLEAAAVPPHAGVELAAGSAASAARHKHAVHQLEVARPDIRRTATTGPELPPDAAARCSLGPAGDAHSAYVHPQSLPWLHGQRARGVAAEAAVILVVGIEALSAPSLGAPRLDGDRRDEVGHHKSFPLPRERKGHGARGNLEVQGNAGLGGHARRR